MAAVTTTSELTSAPLMPQTVLGSRAKSSTNETSGRPGVGGKVRSRDSRRLDNEGRHAEQCDSQPQSSNGGKSTADAVDCPKKTSEAASPHQVLQLSKTIDSEKSLTQPSNVAGDGASSLSNGRCAADVRKDGTNRVVIVLKKPTAFGPRPERKQNECSALGALQASYADEQVPDGRQSGRRITSSARDGVDEAAESVSTRDADERTSNGDERRREATSGDKFEPERFDRQLTDASKTERSSSTKSVSNKTAKDCESKESVHSNSKSSASSHKHKEHVSDRHRYAYKNGRRDNCDKNRSRLADCDRNANYYYRRRPHNASSRGLSRSVERRHDFTARSRSRSGSRSRSRTERRSTEDGRQRRRQPSEGRTSRTSKLEQSLLSRGTVHRSDVLTDDVNSSGHRRRTSQELTSSSGKHQAKERFNSGLLTASVVMISPISL
jgi:hypothetical protein